MRAAHPSIRARAVRASLALLIVIGAVAVDAALLGGAAITSDVAAADTDLMVVTDARYDVQPAEHRVRISVDATATNCKHDTRTRRFYFDRAYLGRAAGHQELRDHVAQGRESARRAAERAVHDAADRLRPPALRRQATRPALPVRPAGSRWRRDAPDPGERRPRRVPHLGVRERRRPRLDRQRGIPQGLRGLPGARVAAAHEARRRPHDAAHREPAEADRVLRLRRRRPPGRPRGQRHGRHDRRTTSAAHAPCLGRRSRLDQADRVADADRIAGDGRRHRAAVAMDRPAGRRRGHEPGRRGCRTVRPG